MFESALDGLPNVILTPQVGGSTQAAADIRQLVAGKLLPGTRRCRRTCRLALAEQAGYVITDIGAPAEQTVLDALLAIPETVRLRVLS